MTSQIHSFVVVLLFTAVGTGVEEGSGGSASRSGDKGWHYLEHLASKTPYQHYPRQHTEPDGSWDCTPLHLNLVARHGSRQPTKSNIRKLEKLQQVVAQHQHLIPDQRDDRDFKWLKAWTNPFGKSSVAGDLVPNGEKELYQLAKRLVTAFPGIFDGPYNPHRLVLQSTQKHRAGRSANSFAFGMLEGQGLLGESCSYLPHFVYSETPSMDNTLRFFDNCPRYIKEVMDNKEVSQKEAHVYKEAIGEIAHSLGLVLGVYPAWNITIEEAIEMYTACAFDVAVLDREDMFCSLFGHEEFKMFEYYHDLKSYWTMGYGNDINWKISYLLLKEMVEIMDGVLLDKHDYIQRAKLRFAHAETLTPFVALLGLFKDEEKLLHDSPSGVIADRKWRTSRVSPFAANIAILLYNCTDGARVKLLHNEEEVEVPGCGSMYCPYEQFKELYAEKLNYDFQELCELPVEPIENLGEYGELCEAEILESTLKSTLYKNKQEKDAGKAPKKNKKKEKDKKKKKKKYPEDD